MIALLDGDIIAYRNAAVVGEDSVEFAYYGCEKVAQDIIDSVGTTEYQVYLTGSKNFRKQINPEYKANRKDKPKPPHLQACLEYLMEEWDAVYLDEVEADDLLGIAADKCGDEHGYGTVICSIDKDLLQIPGYHYNFVNRTFSTVSKIEGIRHFYKQMLIGDVADNIFGIAGIGPVKAGRLLDHIEDEREMMNIVCDLYKDADRFQMNADCLWIMREPDQQWSDRFVTS